jgi:hypothetical protein
MPKIRPDVIRRALDRHVTWENGGTWRHVAGDFDGQGMSLGSIQFAAGQGTLQPILRKVAQEASQMVFSIFGDDKANKFLSALNTDSGFVSWAKSINDENLNIPEPWHSMFETLANTDVFKAIELPFIQPYIAQAESIINWFESNSTGDSILTDRGFDLAFDTACQLWSPAYYPLGETGYFAKLEAIAWAARSTAAEQWKFDTYSRKIAIAKPDGGMVHGTHYKGQYDDKPMYQEETDMANAYTGEPELNEVREKPEQEQPKPQTKMEIQLDAMRHLQERGILPADEDIMICRNTPITWGEVALMFHRNNSYLWENHLKYIRRD